MILERLSWLVTCPNHISFRLLTVARRTSCEPPRKLILLCTQPLVVCSENFSHALDFENLDPFDRVCMQSPCFKAVEEDGNDERLVELELACEADGVAQPYPL